MKSISIEYICPYCAASHTVKVTAAVPAQISGPPEHCYPAEPAEIDPDTCDYCNKPFDEDTILELASEEYDNERQARADARDARDL